MNREIFARHAAAILLAGLTLLVAGCVSKADLRPGRTRLDKPEINIPAQVVGNLFVVEVKGEKHATHHFLIDTGSSVTLVSPDFARRHATDKAALDAPPVHIRSSDGRTTLLPAVTLRRIELGQARFDNVQALIFDFADLSAHLGIKIDGVLGFPLFRETLFTLDYPQSRLVLRSASPFRESPPLAGTTITFNNNQRTPIISVRLGRETFAALIDSGNDGPLMLNPVGLHPRYGYGPRPGVTVGTLTGTRAQEIGRVEQPLDIGPYRFEKPVADLTDQLSALGGELLRHFTVTFDQAHSQVTFSSNAAGPIPPQPRRSPGVSFSKAPAYWRIASVVPGSPADDAGIQAGDLVTRINGEPVSEWNLRRFEALVKRATELTFTFLRGTQETPMVVPTFDLVP